MNIESIEKIIQGLPTDYQSFILGDFIDMATTKLSEGILSEEEQIQFSNTALLYLLSMYSKEDFVEALHNKTSITTEEAFELVSAFIASLPETTPKEIKIISSSEKPTIDVPLASEIEEVENAINSIHSLRTMSADMQAVRQNETIYTSNQDEILKKPDSVNDAPRSTHPSSSDAPRWGSES